MAELRFLIVADEAHFSQDSKPYIQGVFDEVKTHNFPALHPSFTIVSMLKGDPDQNVTYNVRVMHEAHERYTFEKILHLSTRSGINYHMLNLKNFVFNEPGDYRIEARIDGELQQSTAVINVRQLNEKDAEQRVEATETVPA